MVEIIKCGLGVDSNWTSPLVSLDVSYNTKFHGSIPASMGNLTSMKILNLYGARFNGPIPQTLGDLDRLAELLLGLNQLSGTVNFEMFARVKNLQYLSLGENFLTISLQSKGNCTFPRLKALMLPSCNLTKFPYFLTSSAELDTLQLSRNKIEGRIPEFFWRVWRDTLADLDLSFNSIT
ncbi:hypothetical protein CRG98_035955 [Punica granatum]|uniref:Uncharacterized protein n=1 Tax=Punica granatum TaxID=22663 RepID=A0A2I0IJY3_PUNGR|nr:hypothetical protein CRG98_035955 [Punica granatum]